MRKKILIVVHLSLMLLAWSAWTWLDWRILAVLAVLHLIMLESAGGCPLAHAQFPEDKDKRFYEWWMPKIGIKVRNRRRTDIFMRYILPLIIVGLAIILQVVLHFTPLVHL